MSDASFTPDEVRRLRELLELEEIRRLRRLYSHNLDCGNLDGLAALFATDAVCEFGPYGSWRGRYEIRTNYGVAFADAALGLPLGTLHNTVDHEVMLTGPESATGRTYLIDMITHRGPHENPLIWLGVYDDDYVKVGGSWLFARMALEFLWPERLLSDGFRGVFPPAAGAASSD